MTDQKLHGARGYVIIYGVRMGEFKGMSVEPTRALIIDDPVRDVPETEDFKLLTRLFMAAHPGAAEPDEIGFGPARIDGPIRVTWHRTPDVRRAPDGRYYTMPTVDHRNARRALAADAEEGARVLQLDTRTVYEMRRGRWRRIGARKRRRFLHRVEYEPCTVSRHRQSFPYPANIVACGRDALCKSAELVINRGPDNRIRVLRPSKCPLCVEARENGERR